jgi:stage V sporulation protein SpoVS
MSASLMDGLAGKLAGTLSGAMENARNTTVQAGKNLFQGIGRRGACADKPTTEAGADDATSPADGTKLAGALTGVMQKARKTTVQAGKGIVQRLGRMGAAAGKTATEAGSAAKGVATRVADAVRHLDPRG